ncbi:hypothetical protein VTI74DRAFT_5272 [Chaetomium olivicolor]
MADRYGPSVRAPTSGVSKSRTGMTSAHNVRRNLFQNHLTRRQPAPSSTSSSEELHLDADAQKEHRNGHLFQTPLHSQPSEDDIIVRDHNGEIELGDPPTPTIEDPDEMQALNSQQENERERQRLADAVKQHQIDQHSLPAQPEELLEAVKASLRAKVAALDEDNWLYEREEIPQHR